MKFTTRVYRMAIEQHTRDLLRVGLIVATNHRHGRPGYVAEETSGWADRVARSRRLIRARAERNKVKL